MNQTTSPASEQPAAPGPHPPVTRTEIFGWCMYDVADSAFTTVIVTVIYAPYFTTVVAGSTGYGDSLWVPWPPVLGKAGSLLPASWFVVSRRRRAED